MKPALAAILLTTACSAARPPAGPAPEARVTQVLTEEDLTRKWEPSEEEASMARRAAPQGECAEPTSLIRGSFTRPGAKQVMLSIKAGPCDGPWSKHILVVLEGGREVWRADGATAVRAMDVDGDGQDEWLKLWRDYRSEDYRAEAWLSRTSGDILHIADAEEWHCGANGQVRWTSVSVLVRAGRAEVARGEHWRGCQ